MRRMFLAIVVTIAVVSCGLPGCGQSAPTEPATSNTPPATGDHGDDAQHDGQSDMEKMTAELAKLSADDRVSAEKQHFCPVSGEMLGTMGAPQKIDVNGQQVWICCNGCRDPLLENPDQYLAKLRNE